MSTGTSEDVAGDLATRWWDASADYRAGHHWRAADVALSSADKRLLLLGPGTNSDLHFVTVALRAFLERVGFEVSVMDGELDPSAHRQHVALFPRIAALPVTVGSSIEILDLLVDYARDKGSDGAIGFPDVASIVLPDDFSAGYFARVLLHDFEVHVQSCGAVSTSAGDIGDDIGRRMLQALAQRLSAGTGTTLARRRTERDPEPSSDQARTVARDTDGEPTMNEVNVYVSSQHAEGEGAAAAGENATSGEGAAASSGAEVAQARDHAAAATGESSASAGAPEPEPKRSPVMATIFALILVAAIVLLLAGVQYAFIALIVGFVGTSVAVIRFARGT